ncbi:hypothetical protein G7Y79_00006g019800 [Physcia stellaris]|nr:hypothetical protein G7Y79_00006g019800 [Physcia stellaris]
MHPANPYLIHRPSYQQPPILVRDHHRRSANSHHHHGRHHHHHASPPSPASQLTTLTTLTSTYTRLSTELTALLRENYSLGSHHSPFPSQSSPGLRSAIEKLSEMVHKIQIIDAKAVNSAKSAKPPKRIGSYKPELIMGTIMQLTMEGPTTNVRGMAHEQIGRRVGDRERERERTRERRRRVSVFSAYLMPKSMSISTPVAKFDHEGYMRQAMELAKQSPPKPTNFRVGAILVDEASNEVLATGFTLELPGNTHAEQCCLIKFAASKNVEEGQVADVLPPNTVIYTTMEPCNKRSVGNTPCVERILATQEGVNGGIKTVYLGVTEPEKFVGENTGRTRLEAAGVVCIHVAGLEYEILEVATAGHPFSSPTLLYHRYLPDITSESRGLASISLAKQIAHAGPTASNLADSRDHDVRLDDEFAHINQFDQFTCREAPSFALTKSTLNCSDPHMRLPITLPTVQKSIRTSSLPNRFASNRFSKSQSINHSRAMSSDASDLNIENTNIKTASGVSLDDHQKTLVGSVLDLFAGRPSLKKLSLWADDGVFEDPITVATGRKQYEPQWYGLQAVFKEIERLHHEVTDGGNPIGMDLKTRYVLKGLGKETTIASRINIFYDKDTGKITKVEDKWDGQLPDSSFANAFRQLNSVTVPTMVSVPKTDEEDAKRGNQ